MRAAVAESIARAGGDRWPARSIVLCTSCGRPIYRLLRGIGAGERLGRAAAAFAPLRFADFEHLMRRTDLEPGWRARWRSEGRDVWRARYADMREPRAGDPCKCPICGETFVQARVASPEEFIDRAFTVELVTLPPEYA